MNYRYDFSIELLEDLHTGTGMGDLVRDSLLARDEQGRPYIDRHHLRCLLRDNGVRLATILAGTDDLVVTHELVAMLFGTEGGRQRMLDCGSLRLREQISEAEANRSVLLWSASARRLHTRQPEESSLRTVEYLAAGTQLHGWFELLRVSDPEQKESLETALRAILKFTRRLGGGRSRGDGQFKQVRFEASAAAKAKDHSFVAVQARSSKGYRLVFVNEEPLTLMRSAHAGNILGSESHVSGRTLLGGLVAAASGGQKPSSVLFASGVSMGNAYPVPSSVADDELSTIEVMPYPAHLHRFKAPPAQGGNGLQPPHWFAVSQASEQLDQTDIDLFAYKLSLLDDQASELGMSNVQLRRPKGELYLYRAGKKQPWYRFEQPLPVRMRNRRGDPVRAQPRKKSDLFSEQRIPAGTRFVTDCWFGDEAQTVQAWQAALDTWRTTPIRLGRGKVPCRLLGVSDGPDLASDAALDQQGGADPNVNWHRLTVTLTSDWRIPCPATLGDLGRLGEEQFEKLFSPDGNMPEVFYEAQERQMHGSFNFASALPRRPYPVIRRGSSFCFASTSRNDVVALKQAIERQNAWGEGQREGYGRYRFDLDVGVGVMPELQVLQQAQKQDDAGGDAMPLSSVELAHQAAKDYTAQHDLNPTAEDLATWSNQWERARFFVPNGRLSNLFNLASWGDGFAPLLQGEQPLEQWFGEQREQAQANYPAVEAEQYMNALIDAMLEVFSQGEGHE